MPGTVITESLTKFVLFTLLGGGNRVSVGSAQNVWVTNQAQEIWNWNGSAWSKIEGAAVDVPPYMTS